MKIKYYPEGSFYELQENGIFISFDRIVKVDLLNDEEGYSFGLFDSEVSSSDTVAIIRKEREDDFLCALIGSNSEAYIENNYDGQ